MNRVAASVLVLSLMGLPMPAIADCDPACVQAGMKAQADAFPARESCDVKRAMGVECTPASIQTSEYKPGVVGIRGQDSLMEVNPKLNPWYKGESDPGQRYEVIANLYVYPADETAAKHVRPQGEFVDGRGRVVEKVDLSAISPDDLAYLRRECNRAVQCLGRWDVLITAERTTDAYHWRWIKLEDWHPY